MGTSSSYGGPKGKNPLLPDDFDIDGSSPNNQDDTSLQPPVDNTIEPPAVLWQNAKTQVSKLINDPKKRSIKKALSSYVKAYGGGRNAAKLASSGKKTTIKLGNFLSNISSIGFKETISLYKIDFIGRSTEDVLNELINYIAPVPETKEDSIARNALLDAIEILYIKISENNDNIEILDNLDENTFENLMKTYIISYIFQRFLNDFESRFEIYAQNSGSALNLEREIKEYIAGIVDINLNKQTLSNIDYTSKEVIKIINNIYADCYDVIEGVF